MSEKTETTEQAEEKQEKPKTEKAKTAKVLKWKRNVSHKKEYCNKGDEVTETDPAEIKRLKKEGYIA